MVSVLLLLLLVLHLSLEPVVLLLVLPILLLLLSLLDLSPLCLHFLLVLLLLVKHMALPGKLVGCSPLLRSKTQGLPSMDLSDRIILVVNLNKLSGLLVVAKWARMVDRVSLLVIQVAMLVV